MPAPAAAGAVLAGAGALLSILVPALAAEGGRSRRIAAAAGAVLLLAGGGAVAAGAGPGAAAAALLPLAGFAVLLAGAARALRALRAPRAAAGGLAALLGAGLLVLPFLGDPLVEPGGAGRSSPAAVRVLLGGSPAAASIGGGLGVDLLRTPRAYGGASGGGLSRIGAFYAYDYPGPAASAAGMAVAGILLLAGAGVARAPAGK